MKASELETALLHWGKRLFGPGTRTRWANAEHWQDGSLGAANGEEVRRRLRALLCRAPEVVVKVTGGGRGMAPIKAHLSYISRRGALPLEDERGEQILGEQALSDLAQEWRFARSAIASRSHRREALHLTLSMPPPVDRWALLKASRDFAHDALARHKFAMVLHEPQTDLRSLRPHVHLIVRKQGQDGARLEPGPADLALWREQFADRLRQWGIAASATSRRVRGELRWAARADRDGSEPLALTDAGNERSRHEAAAEHDVLSAWHAVAGALSRSEDPRDRLLARQAIEFVREMPIVARRQTRPWMLERSSQAPRAEKCEATREHGEVPRAARPGELERTR